MLTWAILVAIYSAINLFIGFIIAVEKLEEGTKWCTKALYWIVGSYIVIISGILLACSLGNIIEGS